MLGASRCSSGRDTLLHQLSGEQFLVPGSVAIIQERPEWTIFNALVGDITESVSLDLRAEVQAVVVDERHARQVAFAGIVPYIQPGQEVSPGALRFTRGTIEQIEPDGRVTFVMIVSGNIAESIDADDVRSRIAGVSVSEAMPAAPARLLLDRTRRRRSRRGPAGIPACRYTLPIRSDDECGRAMTTPPSWRLLGIDYGLRIGPGPQRSTGSLARPLQVLRRTSKQADFAAINAIIQQHGAAAVVVGLPESPPDITVYTAADRVRLWASRLAAAVDVPVYLWNERHSTQEAEELLAEAGRARPERVDAIAAAVILQSFLNALRDEGFPWPDPVCRRD